MHSRLFESQGFVIAEATLTPPQIARVETALEQLTLDAVGTRNLLDQSWCCHLARDLKAQPLIASLLPPHSVAVQCTLFEKSIERNWLVPFHQDLTIPVRARVDHPLLSRWSEKEDTLYVEPPVAVLEQLVAVRVHIDDCGPNNGPLKSCRVRTVRGAWQKESSLRCEKRTVNTIALLVAVGL